jgi:hypothetical protein
MAPPQQHKVFACSEIVNVVPSIFHYIHCNCLNGIATPMSTF